MKNTSFNFQGLNIFLDEFCLDVAIYRCHKRNTVEPAKSNHPGENTKVVALCRWLLCAGSIVGAMNQSYVYSILDPSIPMCYKPNIYDIKGVF